MMVVVTILAFVVAVQAIATVAVMRRLNGIKVTILKGGPASGEREHGLPRGARVPEVVATDVSGTAVTTRALAVRRGLIGFFSATCKPCLDAVEPFLALANAGGDASATRYAVVSGRGDEAAALLSRFEGQVNFVVHEDGPGGMPGALSGPFKIRRWPAFVAISAEGRVFTHRLPEDAAARLRDPRLVQTGR